MNGAGQQQTDQTANFFWMIILVVLCGMAFWFFGEKYIVTPVFWVRHYELKAIIFLAELWKPIAQYLHLPTPNLEKMHQFDFYLTHTAASKAKWENFATVNTYVGNIIRYPTAAILVVLALFMYFRHGTARFHNSYNTKTLREKSQEVWPQITPIVQLNLAKEDIEKGPWAMAKLPLHFCQVHNLLYVKSIDNRKVWALKQKQAYRLMVLQLGPVWRGIDALPIYIKALIAICFYRAVAKRKVANKFLFQIAASAAHGKLDFTGVEETMAEIKQHNIIRWLEKRHAYVTTILASMLEIGRSDGVLATSEFLWLKPVDRRMWYMLNTVGRSTPVVEIAGAYSHWIAEKRIGRALKTPMVTGAVDALDEALQNILYVDEGDKWQTNAG